MASISMAPDFLLTVWDWELERVALHAKAFGQVTASNFLKEQHLHANLKRKIESDFIIISLPTPHNSLLFVNSVKYSILLL